MPDYLPAVPADPFAERDRVMQYKQLNDSVRIYSVGANGIDDGGDPPEFQEGFLFLGAPGTGDLILQSHFANEGIGDDDAGAAD